MSWYCDLAPGHPVHHVYHEQEYGFAVHDDRVLFERLCLEIFQAGLSWELILKRRASLKQAFSGFNPGDLAGWGEGEACCVLQNPGIIRNKLKVKAILGNARTFVSLATQYGSMAEWLDAHHPLPLGDWIKLFRRTFTFAGPEIVNEFLMSTGWLPGAHRADCPVYSRIMATDPPWQQAVRDGFVYS